MSPPTTSPPPEASQTPPTDATDINDTAMQEADQESTKAPRDPNLTSPSRGGYRKAAKSDSSSTPSTSTAASATVIPPTPKDDNAVTPLQTPGTDPTTPMSKAQCLAAILQDQHVSIDTNISKKLDAAHIFSQAPPQPLIPLGGTADSLQRANDTFYFTIGRLVRKHSTPQTTPEPNPETSEPPPEEPTQPTPAHKRSLQTLIDITREVTQHKDYRAHAWPQNQKKLFIKATGRLAATNPAEIFPMSDCQAHPTTPGTFLIRIAEHTKPWLCAWMTYGTMFTQQLTPADSTPEGPPTTNKASPKGVSFSPDTSTPPSHPTPLAKPISNPYKKAPSTRNPPPAPKMEAGVWVIPRTSREAFTNQDSHQATWFFAKQGVPPANCMNGPRMTDMEMNRKHWATGLIKGLLTAAKAADPKAQLVKPDDPTGFSSVFATNIGSNAYAVDLTTAGHFIYNLTCPRSVNNPNTMYDVRLCFKTVLPKEEFELKFVSHYLAWSEANPDKDHLLFPKLDPIQEATTTIVGYLGLSFTPSNNINAWNHHLHSTVPDKYKALGFRFVHGQVDFTTDKTSSYSQSQGNYNRGPRLNCIAMMTGITQAEMGWAYMEDLWDPGKNLHEYPRSRGYFPFRAITGHGRPPTTVEASNWAKCLTVHYREMKNLQYTVTKSIKELPGVPVGPMGITCEQFLMSLGLTTSTNTTLFLAADQGIETHKDEIYLTHKMEHKLQADSTAKMLPVLADKLIGHETATWFTEDALVAVQQGFQKTADNTWEPKESPHADKMAAFLDQKMEDFDANELTWIEEALHENGNYLDTSAGDSTTIIQNMDLILAAARDAEGNLDAVSRASPLSGVDSEVTILSNDKGADLEEITVATATDDMDMDAPDPTQAMDLEDQRQQPSKTSQPPPLATHTSANFRFGLALEFLEQQVEALEAEANLPLGERTHQIGCAYQFCPFINDLEEARPPLCDCGLSSCSNAIHEWCAATMAWYESKDHDQFFCQAACKVLTERKGYLVDHESNIRPSTSPEDKADAQLACIPAPTLKQYFAQYEDKWPDWVHTTKARFRHKVMFLKLWKRYKIGQSLWGSFDDWKTIPPDILFVDEIKQIQHQNKKPNPTEATSLPPHNESAERDEAPP